MRSISESSSLVSCQDAAATSNLEPKLLQPSPTTDTCSDPRGRVSTGVSVAPVCLLRKTRIASHGRRDPSRHVSGCLP